MHFHSLVFASLMALTGNTLAAPERRGAHDYYCFTSMTDKPAPYQTHWTGYGSTCTKTRTTTKVVKTTIPADTSTITSTTTVTATTSTLTDTETDTVTSTDTSTTTETTTTTSTSTVPFLPVQTTLPDSAYSGSGGPVVKRDLPEPAAKRDPLNLGINIGGATSPKQYPKGVTCYKHGHSHCVQAVTTVTSTRTVTSGPKTTTIVESSTVYPSATTTTTITSTATTTTTTTETSTSTITTTTTEAANCNANNFADNISGTVIDDGYLSGPSNSATTTTAASALACCLASLVVPGSEAFFYLPSGTTNNCAVYFPTSGTCPSQDSYIGTVFTGTRTPQIVVGNLGCGEITMITPETS